MKTLLFVILAFVIGFSITMIVALIAGPDPTIDQDIEDPFNVDDHE